MISQISTIRPPTRMFTSGRRAAAVVAKCCGLGPFFPLPGLRRIHVRKGLYMAYAASRATSVPTRQPILNAGVSWLPMAWDAEIAPHQVPANVAEHRAGDLLRDMSYNYTTDLAAVRAVVYRYAKQAGLP